jgi:drug/metabolite transporter (DMT)-like permease
VDAPVAGGDADLAVDARVLERLLVQQARSRSGCSRRNEDNRLMQPPATRRRAATAVSMILVAMLLFSTMDAGVKYVSAYLPLTLVLWVRYAVQAVVMSAWIARTQGRRGFRAEHPRFQLARGSLLLIVSALAFYSVKLMPLAEFTAILMLWPVLATAAMGLLFREHVSAVRWVLVFGGFVGTVIVVRPGSGLFGWAALVPILTMIVATAYNLLTSRLALLDDPFTTQWYAGVTGTVLLTPFVLVQAAASMELLRGTDALLLSLPLAIGACGTIGHLLLVMAFSRAGTATLMPFTYAQIGFAALMGWLVFATTPDVWAWIGMIVIALCGALSAWFNMRDAQRAGRAAAVIEPPAD